MFFPVILQTVIISESCLLEDSGTGTHTQQSKDSDTVNTGSHPEYCSNYKQMPFLMPINDVHITS